MNILLINPQTPYLVSNKEYYIPSSLLYLAAVLKQSDNNVNILDLNTFKIDNDFKEEKKTKKYGDIIIDRISNFRPSFIGITCLFSGQFPLVLNYSKKIKEKFINIPITIGGIHPTIFPYEILSNCPSIDYIIIGEGEESIVKLVNYIATNHPELETIDGLAYRYNDIYNDRYNDEIKIIVNRKTSFITDLDKIPFPSYDLINLRDYYYNTDNWHNPKELPINCSVPIISSRSCPMRCNFCSMFTVMGPRHRKRSPKNVVDEIEFLYRKYNHRHFSFMDDSLTFDRDHVLGICEEIIKRNLDIQFETPNGISTGTLDEEILDKLVLAGLVRISLAIESGSDYIRNEIMGKRLSREKIFEVIRLTKKYEHLYVRAFFIMGMPEDTRKTLWDTYNMIKDIDIDKPIVFNLLPFPGTKLFKQAMKDNLFLNDINPKDLWKMEDIYLTDNKRFFIKPYNIEIEELNEFRNRFDELTKTIIDRKTKI